MREQIIAEYHADLLRDRDLHEELFARLKSKMRALLMLYGERELGVALRPHFLTRQQYEKLAHCARTLASAMNRMAEAVFEDEARLQWLGLTEREHQLALVHPGFAQPAIHTRVDGFVFRNHREIFILKPNDDYGGRGIYFGNRSSEAEWDDALAVALAGDYIVQELIDLHTEEFPIFSDREWGIQPMYVDTNPFIFRGEPNGALVRLSDSPIVNVTSGGGETGFFVIEEND